MGLTVDSPIPPDVLGGIERGVGTETARFLELPDWTRTARYPKGPLSVVPAGGPTALSEGGRDDADSGRGQDLDGRRAGRRGRTQRSTCLTHALHYGSGIFEGIRAYETKQGAAVFRLVDHMRRLFRSAHLYHMEIPYSAGGAAPGGEGHDPGRTACRSCYIRPLVIRGYGEMGLNPLVAPIKVSIAVWPWGAYLGEDALRVRRPGQDLLLEAQRPQHAAAGSEGDRPVHQLEPGEDGGAEGRLRRGDHAEHAGHVSDGTGENVFIVRDGVRLHAAARRVLPGRDSPATRSSRSRATRATRSSSATCRAWTCTRPTRRSSPGRPPRSRPIREVDDRKVGANGRGPITKELQGPFFGAAPRRDRPLPLLARSGRLLTGVRP